MYQENNEEVVSKLCLGQERATKTNPSTHPRAVQKNVDNPKQVQNLVCKDLHTNDRISFGRETPNWGYTRCKYAR